MKSFKEFQESVAQEVGGKSFTGAVLSGVANLTKGPLTKASKVANIFRSDKGKKILKGLFGTPDKPKWDEYDKTDSLPKPKDDVDSELNTRQRQVKDAEKNKEFDTDMDSFRKGEKNISPEDKIQRLKDAAKKKKI